MTSRKAQVSIFVIIAIVIVVAIAIFFFISGRVELGVDRGSEFESENFIGQCLRESVREKIPEVAGRGGIFMPMDFVKVNDDEIAYLCKNVNYYEPCIFQHPKFIEKFENEISEAMREDIENCFISLEDELSERGVERTGGDFDTEVVLKPGVAEIVVSRDFSVGQGDGVSEIEEFRASINSGAYGLASVAQEIASQEARYCYFEYVGYNLLYNEHDVRKTSLTDGAKVYTIKDKFSGEIMKIAIRGCVSPAGF